MKAKILIADDSAYMRSILKDLLLRNGYDVIGEAENGKEVLGLYRKLKPDVVAMDIMMPEMSGIQALKEIKENYPEARVVMSAAMGQQHLVVEAIRAGAADFFIKPVQAERVVEAIDKALQHR
ncbi:MAG: response regulator [Synergistaceae bacterium]|nr:response regulator [Synergistaceae bacterium]NCB27349.1 response regulator [Bacteroidia bacterium]NCC61948.1 response regulator [Verrucomicrobiae bacterium]PKL04748.1 MAG: two-component system response regulator [Synergistetes bacterium HGW-Synergistetes-1]MDD4751494.1 response regulator [Synergistaceae bacterium]